MCVGEHAESLIVDRLMLFFRRDRHLVEVTIAKASLYGSIAQYPSLGLAIIMYSPLVRSTVVCYFVPITYSVVITEAAGGVDAATGKRPKIRSFLSFRSRI